MSTAVMEPVSAKEPDQVPAYTMPAVALGQHIIVYPGGQVSDRNAVPAIVIRSFRRTLTANCFSHGDMATLSMTPKEQLRHVSDPELSNPYIAAEGGAWDYTPWEKALRAEMEELKSTVTKLVADLGGPAKGRKDS